MDFPLIRSLLTLSDRQKATLLGGGFKDIADVLLSSSSEISRACRIPPQEAGKIIATICRERMQPLRPLGEFLAEAHDEMFTTGDAELDSVLGGGIRTGMLWEAVGESAAGKTQLALQLSLFVQLPPSHGGLSGTACYITIASHLQTTRLEQILNAHPMLSPTACTLSDVQTVHTPTVEKLIYILSTFLPQYISTADQSSKPLKLVVIDALAELFHNSTKTTTQTLVERSRRVSEISTLVHSLASKHRIAFLILNEVTDVIIRDVPPDYGTMSYRDQSRWFGRPNSIPGEDSKEASLGLVWANQVNARIFLSRTRRRRYFESGESDQPMLIRRLSVVFNSVSSPVSCDYIVTPQGISVIPGNNTSAPLHRTPLDRVGSPDMPSTTDPSVSKVSSMDGKQLLPSLPPLDIGCVEDSFAAEAKAATPEDEWDSFWTDNALPDDMYTQINLPTASTS